MKKLVAIVVAIVLVLSLFPPASLAAAKSTVPVNLTESQVKQRMDELMTCLGGKYFTVSGKYCKKPGEKGHSCSNCSMPKVIAESGFKKLVKDKVPSQTNISGTFVHYYGSSSYTRGSSCSGFANYALWYIFAGRNTDAVKTINLTAKAVSFNYDTMKSKAKPGDIIRTSGGHSAIVYSVNKKTVTVIDCNWNIKAKGNCFVSKHDISYADYSKVGIARAANYACYVISYNANGGRGVPSAQTKVTNVALTLSTVKPTRTGAIFKGWSTKPNGAVEYAVGGKYTKNESVTLYAIWGLYA